MCPDADILDIPNWLEGPWVDADYTEESTMEVLLLLYYLQICISNCVCIWICQYVLICV